MPRRVFSQPSRPGAALRMADGTLVFGGINGYNAFRPESIARNEHVPPVVITRFRTGAAPWRPGAGAGEIELGPRDRFLRLEFAALDFRRPDHNRYVYRLEGLIQNSVV